MDTNKYVVVFFGSNCEVIDSVTVVSRSLVAALDTAWSIFYMYPDSRPKVFSVEVGEIPRRVEGSSHA